MANQSDIVTDLANEVIRQLEAGTAPWVRTWDPGEFPPFPANLVTGRCYTNSNALRLHLAQPLGSADPRWCTFKQAESVNAPIRAGAKGHRIIIVRTSSSPALDDNGKPRVDDNGKPLPGIKKKMLASATVFHASDVEGTENMTERPLLWKPCEEAEKIAAKLGVSVTHSSSDRAFYDAGSDTIAMPARDSFPTAESYYGTLLHEMGHATGHESRLNRIVKTAPPGSEEYAFEELVAEMASFQLCTQLGLGHSPGHHINYIASWVRLLKEDPRVIHQAAEKATNAVTFLAPDLMKNLEIAPMDKKPEIEKYYLVVPYEERAEAKALGAKWDKANKKWFLPVTDSFEETVASFKQWDPKHIPMAPVISPEEEFMGVARGLGLVIDHLVEGEMTRVPVADGKPNKRDGAYVYHAMQQIPGGYAKNHKTGEEVKWRSTGKGLSPEESRALSEKSRIAREEREKEREAGYAAAADACQEVWDNLLPAVETDTHPYLEAKGLNGPAAFGLRVNAAGDLVAALTNLDGKITTIQTITENGFKRYTKGARSAGAVFTIGSPPDAPESIYVTTGIRTGAAVAQVTRHPVICAMSDGHLPGIVEEIARRSPATPILVFGDNDHNKEKNSGLEHATKAVVELPLAVAVFPEVSAKSPDTDFADILQSQGPTSVLNAERAGLEALNLNSDAQGMVREGHPGR